MKGSVLPRYKGRKDVWRLTVELGDGPDGKRRRYTETVPGTKGTAQQRLRELLTSMDRGGFVQPSKETVGELLQRWLTTYVQTNTGPETQRGYAGVVRRYLLPSLASIPLARLSPHHVQSLYAEMRRRGLSPTTIQHTHRVLSEALHHAVRWQLVGRNVCEAVDPPAQERKEAAVYTVEEVRVLLRALAGSPPYADVYFIALLLGLRRSEVLGLGWGDVSLEDGTVHIRQGLHRLNGRGLVLLPTKTQKSTRQIPIPPVVVDWLREVHRRQLAARLLAGPAWHDTGFVFTTADGRPLDPEKVSKGLRPITDAAGLPPLTVHGLRHTHSTLSIGVNREDVKAVSERLGHSSTRITLETYHHVLPGGQEEGMRRFAELVAG